MRKFTSVSGNLALIREYDFNQEDNFYSLPKRKDTLNVNIQPLICNDEREVYLNYFGNFLFYKKNPTKNNEWNNVKNLFSILEKISFTNSGILDNSNSSEYLTEGFLLKNCEECIEKISVSLPNNEYDINYISGSINIYFNSFKILTDRDLIYNAKLTTGDVRNDNFITFKNSDQDIFNYSKTINESKLPKLKNNFLNSKPFYWEEINLNSKFITPVSNDGHVNKNYSGQINSMLFSGKAISGYKIIPNDLDKYEKIKANRLLENFNFLNLEDYSREIFLAVHSGMEPYEYGLDADNLPEVNKVYDYVLKKYKNRALSYRQNPTSNYLPAPFEKHILLFDLDLYGFSGEKPEDCDVEANVYVLDEGNFADLIKNPVPLKLKVQDLKNTLTGQISNIQDILKEKDIITGVKVNTNINLDQSFYMDSKKYPYESIKMNINIRAPDKYCYDIPQYYLFSDENLTKLDRLKSYTLSVSKLEGSQKVNFGSGVFVSGIQTGFLLLLRPGEYEFTLSGINNHYIQDFNNKTALDYSLNKKNISPPDYTFNICQIVDMKIENAGIIYDKNVNSVVTAQDSIIKINGEHKGISQKNATYYEYNVNERIYRENNLNYIFNAPVSNLYKIKMRSVCTDCEAIKLRIENSQDVYWEDAAERITTKSNFIKISGYDFTETSYAGTSYELDINGEAIILQKPYFEFYGNPGISYKVKMRSICNYNL